MIETIIFSSALVLNGAAFLIVNHRIKTIEARFTQHFVISESDQ